MARSMVESERGALLDIVSWVGGSYARAPAFMAWDGPSADEAYVGGPRGIVVS